jgi:hypothetical protein
MRAICAQLQERGNVPACNAEIQVPTPMMAFRFESGSISAGGEPPPLSVSTSCGRLVVGIQGKILSLPFCILMPASVRTPSCLDLSCSLKLMEITPGEACVALFLDDAKQVAWLTKASNTKSFRKIDVEGIAMVERYRILKARKWSLALFGGLGNGAATCKNERKHLSESESLSLSLSLSLQVKSAKCNFCALPMA